VERERAEEIMEVLAMKIFAHLSSQMSTSFSANGPIFCFLAPAMVFDTRKSVVHNGPLCVGWYDSYVSLSPMFQHRCQEHYQSPLL
jgi:hypothetical protein